MAKYNKDSKIESVKDVQDFFDYLVNDLHLSFHPDDDFEEYPLLSQKEADLLNGLMDRAFMVCDKADQDIYDLAIETIQKS